MMSPTRLLASVVGSLLLAACDDCPAGRGYPACADPRPPALPPDPCGNGTVDVGEECDGDSCCNADCTKKACFPGGPISGAVCGNGKVEAGEQCDDGKNNGTVADACSSACKVVPSTCGNANIEPGEECDLGTGNSCDEGAAAACTCTCKNKKCGDAIVQQGECCDDGKVGPSQLLSNCTVMCTASKDPADPSCKCP